MAIFIKKTFCRQIVKQINDFYQIDMLKGLAPYVVIEPEVINATFVQHCSIRRICLRRHANFVEILRSSDQQSIFTLHCLGSKLN